MKTYWPFLVGGLLLCVQLYATVVGSGNVFHVDRLSASVTGTSQLGDQAKMIEELSYKARINATICDGFVHGSYLFIIVWLIFGLILIRRQKALRQ